LRIDYQASIGRHIRQTANNGGRNQNSDPKLLGPLRPKNVTTVKPSGGRPWYALTSTTKGILTLEELFADHEDDQDLIHPLISFPTETCPTVHC
jgi:hypothetical protein